jgi:hypothetical protein
MKLPIILLAILASIGTSVVTVVNAGPAIAQSKSRPSQNKTYNLQNLSFQAPQHWIDYSDKASDMIMLFNQKLRPFKSGMAPANMIKLDAGIHSGDLETLITQEPDPRSMPVEVVETEILRINGKKAFRKMIKSDDQFQSAQTLYLSYGSNQIAHVTIFYNAENPQAIKFIRSIFDSVKIR